VPPLQQLAQQPLHSLATATGSLFAMVNNGPGACGPQAGVGMPLQAISRPASGSR